MHYYQHNIGDYLRDTHHLSLMEHGAYRQLLDLYYLNEGNIPEETKEVFRRLRAITDEEKNAVQMVLDEFFFRTENGWKHARCDREIASYQAKANRARDNGKLGGRPKKTKVVSEKTNVVVSGNPEETQTKANHKPITNNQEQNNNTRSRAVTFPDDVPDQVRVDFIALRKAKKAPLTQTALDGIAKEAQKAGITLTKALELCCQRGWQGFNSGWLTGTEVASTDPNPVPLMERPVDEQKKAMDEFTAKMWRAS